MKIFLFLVLLCLSGANVASDDVACTMFLCAYGQQESGGCASAIHGLKQITAFSRHHHHWFFDCAATRAKRLVKLLACQEAPRDQVASAINWIGCLR